MLCTTIYALIARPAWLVASGYDPSANQQDSISRVLSLIVTVPPYQDLTKVYGKCGWQLDHFISETTSSFPASIRKVLDSYRTKEPLLELCLSVNLWDEEDFAKERASDAVVFGRIQLPQGGDVQTVLGQTEVLKDGFVVTAVRTVKQPIYFWMHGYEPLTVWVKKPTKTLFVDLGVLVMQPLAASHGATVTGRVELPTEETITMGKVTSQLCGNSSLPNTANGGTTSIRAKEPARLDTPLLPTGEFTFKELVPTGHCITPHVPGYVFSQTIVRDLKPGERRNGLLFKGEIARTVSVDYRVTSEAVLEKKLTSNIELSHGDTWKLGGKDNHSLTLFGIEQRRGELYTVDAGSNTVVNNLGTDNISMSMHKPPADPKVGQHEGAHIQPGHLYTVYHPQGVWVFFKVRQ